MCIKDKQPKDDTHLAEGCEASESVTGVLNAFLFVYHNSRNGWEPVRL